LILIEVMNRWKADSPLKRASEPLANPAFRSVSKAIYITRLHPESEGVSKFDRKEMYVAKSLECCWQLLMTSSTSNCTSIVRAVLALRFRLWWGFFLPVPKFEVDFQNLREESQNWTGIFNMEFPMAVCYCCV